MKITMLLATTASLVGLALNAATPALDAASEWISVKNAPVFEGKNVTGARAAAGTSWFFRAVTNRAALTSAKWTVSGLGVFEVFVNGRRVGNDVLKPGFTHNAKTKYAFTYDVLNLMNRAAGASNALAAEVSAGWWRDKIVSFVGKKSAFRGELVLTYADGSREVVGTRASEWASGVAGPVTTAAIFDGEEYDARIAAPTDGTGLSAANTEVNGEFTGEILPTDGAEVCLREDLALLPKEAYRWKGVANATSNAFGTVVRTKTFDRPAESVLIVEPGETLVVDFAQNCAAVPRFRFRAAEGTVLTALPAEMLNDGNGAKSRGNDGPEGSVYRLNLRCPADGMRAVYTFGKGGDVVEYLPRFTFFGYRYLSVTATGRVTIERLESVPVTSIRKGMESGRIEVGEKDVNRLISNVYWGQLSNYLSVPTDCPQRNERLGWAADTQVFCEAASFNADVYDFLRKWMRDERDSQDSRGGFPGVAPFAQYGNDPMRLGWADAGVIVPYQMFKQYGDRRIVDENWAAMEKFVSRVNETKYATANIKDECENYQWNDWLSLTRLESCPYKPEYAALNRHKDGTWDPKPEAVRYWDYLGGCYWAWDAQMMAEMAALTGRADAAEKYRKMSATAKDYLKATFFTADGTLEATFEGMQTPMLFALKLGLVEGAAKVKTVAAFKASVAANGGTLHTGFLGTSIVMDTLTENGMVDLAYDLLLNHKFPGWLYSVDQGATTIWERWNSYTKKDGFGPVSMNSFNHYAYGAVLAWIYKTAAGIAADPTAPGFRNVILAPKPDRRLGFVKAEYKSSAGLIKSAWRYEGDQWVWEFSIPAGAKALVTLPGEDAAHEFAAGDHRITRKLK